MAPSHTTSQFTPPRMTLYPHTQVDPRPQATSVQASLHPHTCPPLYPQVEEPRPRLDPLVRPVLENPPHHNTNFLHQFNYQPSAVSVIGKLPPFIYLLYLLEFGNYLMSIMRVVFWCKCDY